MGQFDIKKVLAYSTISQLGYMVAAIGLGADVAAIFHLVTHAFFKALLFLSAGSVILGVERGIANSHKTGDHGGHVDPQDMRNMGGLRKNMPVTFVVYLIGALALSGVAPLSGFFSKDEILAAANDKNMAVFILLAAAAFLTAFYMGRQILMVFFGKQRSDAAVHANESSPLVTVPLVILAVLAVLGGALNFPGLMTLEHWLEHTLNIPQAAAFVIPVAVSSTIIALLAIFVAWLVYGRKQLFSAGAKDPLVRPLGVLFTAMNKKFMVDEFYHWLVVNPYLKLSGFLAGVIDHGIIDGFVNGMGTLTAFFAGLLRRLQNGYVRSYALSVVVGIVLILAYLLLRV